MDAEDEHVVARGDVGGRHGEAQTRQAGEQFGEGDARFDAGQLLAQASVDAVDAVAEGQVRGPGPVQVQLVGPGEAGGSRLASGTAITKVDPAGTVTSPIGTSVVATRLTPSCTMLR